MMIRLSSSPETELLSAIKPFELICLECFSIPFEVLLMVVSL